VSEKMCDNEECRLGKNETLAGQADSIVAEVKNEK